MNGSNELILRVLLLSCIEEHFCAKDVVNWITISFIRAHEELFLSGLITRKCYELAFARTVLFLWQD
jgi:hypothetical protein